MILVIDSNKDQPPSVNRSLCHCHSPPYADVFMKTLCISPSTTSSARCQLPLGNAVVLGEQRWSWRAAVSQLIVRRQLSAFIIALDSNA